MCKWYLTDYEYNLINNGIPCFMKQIKEQTLTNIHKSMNSLFYGIFKFTASNTPSPYPMYTEWKIMAKIG